MKNLFIILPVSLFKNVDTLKKANCDIIMVEDSRYFTDFKYHKLKLAYHRASMKYYEDYLKSKKLKVNEYYEFKSVEKDFYDKLSKKYDNVYYYDPIDNEVEKRLNKKNFKKIKSLNFLVDKKFCEENKNEFYKNDKYNFMNFYKMQRRRFNLLVNKDKSPKGKDWTFDTENREKLPKGTKIKDPEIFSNKYIKEAINYVNKNFSKNYGSLDHFIYPVTHKEAEMHLKDFLKNKLKNFGKYEDAISTQTNFVYHSILSPMLNIGLLTDKEVIKELVKYESKVPIQSYEGFIRQLIGWRNYCLVVYFFDDKKMEKMNFFKANLKLPVKHFWEGTTGIKPVDDSIKNIIKYGYSHHIIRLMVLGSFMLMCGFKPMDIYKIFMEWFIDSYDVFMKLNVFAMSQHSVKNLAMKKPYFSSSNYIIKMSDYSAKEEWTKIYDALFYYFINKHKDYLKTNYGYSRLVTLWNKKSKEEKDEILLTVNNYLKKLK